MNCLITHPSVYFFRKKEPKLDAFYHNLLKIHEIWAPLVPDESMNHGSTVQAKIPVFLEIIFSLI